MQFLKSIRFRLTLWYLIVISVLIAAFGGAAYFMLSYELNRNLDESLKSKAVEIETGLRLDAGQVTTTGQPSELVLVYDANGALALRLGPNTSFSKADKLVQLALLGQPGFATQQLESGQQVRLFATPFTLSPSTRFALVIGKPPTETLAVLGTVKSIFGLSAFLAAVLAALGGMVLANRALSPMARITGAAANIGESSLGRRIDIRGEDEVGRLGSTLNQMIDRLGDRL